MQPWSTIPVTSEFIEAKYFLILQSDCVVLWQTALDNFSVPMEHVGDFNSFAVTMQVGTPLIPLDTHTALTLGWVDMARMIRNRPYLDETIKAAIALVA